MPAMGSARSLAVAPWSASAAHAVESVPVQVSAPEASRALEWEWLAGLQLMAPP
jgi:hypothetical protein